MAAPTYVVDYETAWDTATFPKTVSASVLPDECLLVFGAAEADGYTLETPTGGEAGGIEYTLNESVAFSGYSPIYAWSSPVTNTDSFTLSVDTFTTQKWGFIAARFAGSSGVGAAEQTHVSSGAPSLNITTTGDNSALLVMVTDWNAGDGTSRTWRAVNGFTPDTTEGELVYFRDSAAYTVYVAYYPDTGTSGSVCTTGLSAPTGQKYSIVAIEIVGGSTSGDAASMRRKAFAQGRV